MLTRRKFLKVILWSGLCYEESTVTLGIASPAWLLRLGRDRGRSSPDLGEDSARVLERGGQLLALEVKSEYNGERLLLRFMCYHFGRLESQLVEKVLSV